MSFDAQTFDPKSEVDEAIDVLGVPKSVTVEVPEKATREQCQKSTNAKSARGVLPTQLVETTTKKSALSKRSLLRKPPKTKTARNSPETWHGTMI